MSSLKEGRSRVSIHDVAEAAQVSTKTVSRVLRGEAYVAAETRALVEQLARDMGYLPDLSARNLKSSVASTLGLIRAESGSTRAPHEFTMCLQIGAMTACQELDFGLMIVPVPREAEVALAQMRERWRSRQVGGYVIPSQIGDLPGLLEGLDADDIPYAAISPTNAQRASRAVMADERSAARTVVQQLIAAGHRRIAFIRSELHARATVEREAGFRDAMHEAGLAVPREAVAYADDFTFDHGRVAGQRLLAQAEPPTAIFAINDEVAAGVIAAAHERGLVLPQQLSVVGYDDLDLARKLWPQLTTVHHPIEQLGEVAARQVIARLQPLRHVTRQPAARVVLPCDVVVRGSVAPPPQASVSSPSTP